MINRIINILHAEIHITLDKWEEDFKRRTQRKKTKKRTYKNQHSHTKSKSSTTYSNKELQAFVDLEIKPTKDKKLIKKQFKTLIKNYHPDKFQDEEQKKMAEVITKRLIAAYELLTKK